MTIFDARKLNRPPGFVVVQTGRALDNKETLYYLTDYRELIAASLVRNPERAEYFEHLSDAAEVADRLNHVSAHAALQPWVACMAPAALVPTADDVFREAVAGFRLESPKGDPATEAAVAIVGEAVRTAWGTLRPSWDGEPA